jgi:hypothetical protein
MKPSIIVWDLETVPDLAGFAAANDLIGKPDADVRAVLGNQFPKLSTTPLCASARSSLTARAIIGRWTRSVHPTLVSELRSS